MLQKVTRLKKTGIIALCAFLLMSSMQSSAQKTVATFPGVVVKKDKKTNTVATFPGVVVKTDKKTSTVYKGGRRPLPPGQAKKIYGGSAKDYAPGQEKKRKHHKKHHKHHHDHERED